ncbi:putative ABC transporter, peremase protein [Proteiniborus sp. DW1]|uniref:hypothetical protein n=1 Tax=Proteiniborus sp. DW1 TaxID=1889883 RepID=UPI00092DF070|nr:hypothetical protein [Proteiniborus sp. DW1]SCG82570.1 putative ABC transporter, peremase protein [Proteiniborus sp. DW1]
MLGKLMKHELMATSRLLVPLYIALLFISLVNRFVFRLDIGEGILMFFIGFLIFTQVILILAILVTTVLLMIVRFYKNLLSDEGYLMFTLPVNSHQLIISKLTVTLFWLLISTIFVVSSFSAAFITSTDASSIINEIRKIPEELSATFGGNSVILVIELILMIFVSAVTNILVVYASIAIGQLFSKHKIIASLISYVVIYNGLQLIMLLVLVLASFITTNSLNFTNMFPRTIFPISIIMISLIGAVFYIITNRIFEKKLNLD